MRNSSRRPVRFFAASNTQVMTGCTNDSKGSFGFAVDTLPAPKDVPLPRFSLRKRKTCSERAGVGIPSVSSALLDGIFADVAEILQEEGSDSRTKELSATSSEQTACGRDNAFDVSPPSKKSRCSLTHSISRSPKSFKWIDDFLFPSSLEMTDFISRHGSPLDLTPQINVESKNRTFVSQSKVSDWCTAPQDISPSFPHLPAAVSLSSCNTLPRVLSDLHSPASEPEGKDSYGWFIEMDNTEEEKEAVDPYSMNACVNNLAFVASTAPSVGNHDADVEWAKAADTVDSVLGDFF